MTRRVCSFSIEKAKTCPRHFFKQLGRFFFFVAFRQYVCLFCGRRLGYGHPSTTRTCYIYYAAASTVAAWTLDSGDVRSDVCTKPGAVFLARGNHQGGIIGMEPAELVRDLRSG